MVALDKEERLTLVDHRLDLMYCSYVADKAESCNETLKEKKHLDKDLYLCMGFVMMNTMTVMKKKTLKTISSLRCYFCFVLVLRLIALRNKHIRGHNSSSTYTLSSSI